MTENTLKNRRIIIFPLLTWDSALLHREQMLAKGLAASGSRVIYINRITRKPWKILTKSKSSEGDLRIVDILVLPYMKGKIPFIYKLNDFLINCQLGRIGLKNDDVFYLSNPDWAPIVAKIKKKNEVIYDISDDYELLAKNKKWQRIVKDHEAVAKRIADKFVVTNESLFGKIDKSKPWKVICNGVDLKAFSGAKPKIDKENYKKIAGFIGGIYEWIDLDLVKKAAENLPEVLFVLIGPTNREKEIKKLIETTNIKYLGAVDKNEVGDYFASFDIGLVPYVSVAKYPRLITVDSNKIYQYLYFGYPVVSTDFPQVRELEKFVSVAKNEKEFIDYIGKSLLLGVDQKRIDFAKGQSWGNKVKDLIEFIEK